MNLLTELKLRKGFPVVITYHPLSKTIVYIINEHLDISYMDDDFKHVFSPGSIVSFQLARKTSTCNFVLTM